MPVVWNECKQPLNRSEIFCKNVKYACKKKEIRLKDLEKAVGVPNGLRCMKSTVPLNVACKVSKLLRIPLDELCKDTNKEHSM